MGKIIIANVGNRTLIQEKNGKLGDFEFVDKDNFRDETETLLELYKENKNAITDLRLNILNVLIENIGEPIDKIYLFTSNQEGSNSGEKKQDTVYAGKLLKGIIEAKYNIPTIPLCIEGISVIDIDNLAEAFKEKLKNIVFEEHPSASFIVCDSGGTSQQKTALKIIAEYFLPEDRVSFYHVSELYNKEGEIELGKGKLNLQSFYQIRTIADKQNIGILINVGEYKAAAKIREGILTKGGQVTSGDIPLKYLRTLCYRFDSLHSEAKKEFHGLRDAAIPPIVLNYHKNKPSGACYSEWINDLEEYDYFKLCELLEVASFYWFNEDYTNTIIKYQIFFEQFLNFVIKKGFGYDLENRDDKSNFQTNELQTDVKFELGYTKFVIATIPSKTVFLDLHKSDLNLKSIQIIENIKLCYSEWLPSGSIGINGLRNSIAHNGIGVTLNYIKGAIAPNDFLSIIREWHQAMCVPFDKNKNVFVKANMELKKLLKLE